MSGRILFTCIEEAEARLPLVRQLVAEITVEMAWLVVCGRKLRELGESGEHPALREVLNDVVEKAPGRVEDLIYELLKIGVEVRDYEYGVVGFPAVVNGEPGYLSWSLKDWSRHRAHEKPRIHFWHRANESWTARRTFCRWYSLKPPAGTPRCV